METLEKKPQETLNHKKPKSHISFSSLPGQPLTAPVKKIQREQGRPEDSCSLLTKAGRPPRFTFKPHFQSSSPSRCSLGKQNQRTKGAAPLPFLSSSPIFSPPFLGSIFFFGFSTAKAKSTAPSSLRLSSSVSLTGQQQSSFLHQQTQLTASNSLHRLLRRRLQLLPQAQRQPLLSSSPSTDLSSGSFCPRDRPNSPCS